MKLPNTSGIYEIVNTVTQKRYVGYAINLRKRLTIHKHYLRHNKEGNKGLQQDWNKYGESNFDFLVLQECSVENLCAYEHYWVQKLNTSSSDFGYNKRPTKPNDVHISLKKRKRVHPLKGVKPSELCIQKGKEYRINNPMTDKHKTACREGLKKVDWFALRKDKQKRVINIMTGEIYNSLIDVSNLVNIPKSTLSKYLLGKRKNKTNFKYL